MSIARIACVFFAEFHTVLGPKISFQAPEGFIRPDVFEGMSEYVIPKSQLCGRLVTLRTDELTIMGVPVIIENKKYDRNSMLFNLGFAFEPAADTKCYEPVLRKLASVLRRLEVEHEFLYNPQTKALLENILLQLLDDLNTYRESQVPIYEFSSSINIKLFPAFSDPIAVHDYDVPVPTTDMIMLQSEDWDLTMQQVLPFVDGINHLRRIAQKASVDVHLVRKCIQHLVYYGCVRLVDIFQSSNVYAVMPQIHNLFVDTNLQRECIANISLPGQTPPTVADVFAAYCSFQHGTPISAVIKTPRFRSLPVDLRNMVSFGVLKNLLRRVHMYPIRQPAASTIEDSASTPISSNLRRLLNGLTTMDEICVATSHPPTEVEDALALDPHVKIVAK